MSITNASSTQKLVTNAWIAFTGTAPSAANYAAHVAFVGTSGAAAYISFLSSHAKTIPAATLASNLLTNLGLSSVFTAAEALAYINSNLNNLGEAITRVSEATLNYVSDSTFSKNAEMLAAKAAYTATATTALTHSSNSANTSSAQAVTPAPSAPVGPAAPDGATIMLTTGVDKGAAFVGTAKNDVFNAPILTLNAGDEIDGGAGRDTLNATINVGVTATTRISNIEELNFTGLGALTVDTVNMLGVQEFNSVGSTGKMTFTNVGSLTPSFGITGSGNAKVDITLVTGVNTGGADVMKLALEGVTAADFVVTNGGIETVELTVDGTSSSLGVLTAGQNSVIIKGNATSLKYIDAGVEALDGLTVLTSTAFNGALLGNTIGSNGFATDVIDGAADGTTIQLGSGNDNISFKSLTAATKTNTIDLGGGNNKLSFLSKATDGSTFILAGSGNDEVRILDGTELRTTDVISLGAGNDTVRIADDGANALVLLGVENLILESTAVGANTITSANSALAVVAAVNNNLVNIAGLTNGSTVTLNNATDATAGATAVTVAYATKQAAATLTMNAVQKGAIIVNEVEGVTITATDTVGVGGASTIAGDKAVSLTINAAKVFGATTLGADSTILKAVAITGQDAVAITTLNSTVLESINVSGVKDISVGRVTEALKLTSVQASSSTGSVTLSAIGAASKNNTTAATNITVSAAKAVTLGLVADVANAHVIGHLTGVGKIGNVNVAAADGNITFDLGASTGVIAASTIGTVTLNAIKGAIDVHGATGNKLLDVADSSGLVLNLSASTKIAGGDVIGDLDETVIVENEGGITANVAGAASALLTFTSNGDAAARSVVTLNATNTGGATFIVTNNSTVSGAATSTLSMGNAATGKTNLVTIGGTADNVIVNGGTGVDNVAFGATNKIKTMQFKLGAGDNAIDFAALAKPTDGSLGAGTTKTGLAINLSNDDHVFLPNTSNVTTIRANSVGQFEAGASVKNVIAGFSATIDAGTVKTVTGGAQDDFVKANNGSGNIINGGLGNDTIVLGAGIDTVVIVGTASGNDAISTFTVGAGGDKIRLSLAGLKLDAGATADVDLINIDLGTSSVAATDTVVLSTITGATNADALTTDTLILVANLSTNIANAAALQTALEDGGGLALTADGALAAKDAFLVLFDNGINSFLAHVENGATVADNGTFGANTLTATILVTFVGVSDVTSITAQNFEFGA